MTINDSTGLVEEVFQVLGVDLLAFLGPNDELVHRLKGLVPGVEVFVRSDALLLKGHKEQVAKAVQELEQTMQIMRAEGAQSSREQLALKRNMQDDSQSVSAAQDYAAQDYAAPILQVRGRGIRPQTAGQRDYVRAIDQHTITFGIGPAGTGKTYLAVAKAVAALQSREVSKIILTRPAVEAGERLGFLPGTLSEKIDPYLRPLFDAAAAMLDNDVVSQLLASGAIEVAPLAYMRGRTLNEAFVILDEAQNTTPEQMKMFLTRLGYGSKIVVTGDATQADLQTNVSGLARAQKILQGVDDIAFQLLSNDDIVRHSLVGRIVDAYSKFEGAEANRSKPKGARAAGDKNGN